MSTVELLLSLTEAQKQGLRNMLSVDNTKWFPFLEVTRYPYKDASKKQVELRWINDLNEVDILASIYVFSTALIEIDIQEKYKHLLYKCAISDNSVTMPTEIKDIVKP